MLIEGVPAAMIENVGRMAGMPVGPLSLNDEVAVDLAWKILQATEADLGADAIDPRAEGAAGGDGGEARPARPQERQGLLRLSARRARSACGRASPICSRRSSIPTRIDVDELKQRFLVIQALETARCFEEGVLTDVREADVGSILGFGFAPFTGGTLSYIDMMGMKKFVELCRQARSVLRRRALRPRNCCVDMAPKRRDLLRPLRRPRPRRLGILPLRRALWSVIALPHSPRVWSRPFRRDAPYGS